MYGLRNRGPSSPTLPEACECSHPHTVPTVISTMKAPAITHLARGLELFADPTHKLVWGAHDEHISSINDGLEISHGLNVVRQLRVRQVPFRGGGFRVLEQSSSPKAPSSFKGGGHQLGGRG